MEHFFDWRRVPLILLNSIRAKQEKIISIVLKHYQFSHLLMPPKYTYKEIYCQLGKYLDFRFLFG